MRHIAHRVTTASYSRVRAIYVFTTPQQLGRRGRPNTTSFTARQSIADVTDSTVRGER